MNLVEILRDVPKGTELYSPIFGKCYFDRIVPVVYNNDYIVVTVDHGCQKEYRFDKEGKYSFNTNSLGECLLFPSKKIRDWSLFIKPGDVIVSDDVYYLMKDSNTIIFSYDTRSECIGFGCSHIIPKHYIKASNREWFFKKMEENGYEYDPVNISYKEIEI